MGLLTALIKARKATKFNVSASYFGIFGCMHYCMLLACYVSFSVTNCVALNSSGLSLFTYFIYYKFDVLVNMNIVQNDRVYLAERWFTFYWESSIETSRNKTHCRSIIMSDSLSNKMSPLNIPPSSRSLASSIVGCLLIDFHILSSGQFQKHLFASYHLNLLSILSRKFHSRFITIALSLCSK